MAVEEATQAAEQPAATAGGTAARLAATAWLTSTAGFATTAWLCSGTARLASTAGLTSTAGFAAAAVVAVAQTTQAAEQRATTAGGTARLTAAAGFAATAAAATTTEETETGLRAVGTAEHDGDAEGQRRECNTNVHRETPEITGREHQRALGARGKERRDEAAFAYVAPCSMLTAR